MKAKVINGQAPGGKRTKLEEVLPLDTPFVVQVFPVYACNFKCVYCIFSVAKEKRGFVSDKIIMDFNLYQKFIDDLAGFKRKVKVLRLVGIGEPLLHNRIIDMVKYAKVKEVAEKIEILTNGLLLKPEMSDKLIEAGLTRIVISLQGTSAQRYRQISQKEIDFAAFVRNIRYLFEHRGEIDVYLKIADIALASKEEKEKFYKTFGDICDTLAIEHIVPIHSGVNYNRTLKGRSVSCTQFGLPVTEVKICPQPFFTMQINPDGKVVPCYSFDYPGVMGDCTQRSILEIWNSSQFKKFRYNMLKGRSQVSEICAKCNMIKYRLFPEDVISDEAAERLKKLFENC